jgi:NTP pyrophosphatase (non-canonical NTP hydrolase)
MTFQEAIQLYRDIYKRFEKVEGKPWGIDGATIELAKQVGDLAKLIMLKEGYYADCAKKPDNLDEKIGDELADIFGQIIRIADYCEIDLEKAHQQARAGEDECLKAMGV